MTHNEYQGDEEFQGIKLLEVIPFSPPPEIIKKGSISKVKIGLWTIVSGLVLVGVLLILTKSIEIEIMPMDAAKEATYTLDTPWALLWGQRYLLFSGTYNIVVNSPGYHQLNQLVEVGGGKQALQKMSMVMRPTSGVLQAELINNDIFWEQLKKNISIVLEPALNSNSDSQSFIVGISGERVFSIASVEPMDYTLRVMSPYYLPYSVPIKIEGKGKIQTVNIELSPNWGILQIPAVKVNANVFINGEARGKLPVKTKLWAGRHRIKIEAKDFKEIRHLVVIEKGEMFNLNRLKFFPIDRVVQLSSVPSKVTVLLNGQYQGLTPLKLYLSPENRYRIQGIKDGYRMFNNTMVFPAGKKIVNSQIKLTPIRINTAFITEPSHAKLFIDEQLMGSANQEVSLLAVKHKVNIRAIGYEAKQFVLPVSKNSRPRITTKLLTKAQDFWQRLPKVVKNKYSYTMLLFRPNHEIIIGSPESEQGRRMNEGQFLVKVKQPFYASVYETTNAQFKKFNSKHSSSNFSGNSLNGANQPVVNVSWQQAALYCNWLSKQEGFTPFYKTIKNVVSGLNPGADGYRLPTESEWTWLSRFDQQNNRLRAYQIYPWGDDAQFVSLKGLQWGNFADTSARQILKFVVKEYNDNERVSANIPTQYLQHSSGLYNLAGNVSEWVHDWYEADWNLEPQAKISPWGPSIGEFHVVKGASWARGYIPQLRVAYRDYSAKGKKDIGFRIVRSVILPNYNK